MLFRNNSLRNARVDCVFLGLESINQDVSVSVTQEACYPAHCVLVDFPFSQVVKQPLVGYVVEGSRYVQQQEAGHLPVFAVVPLFLDLRSNSV